MDKSILEQYSDLQQEEKDIVNRIHRTEAQLAEMEQKGYVVSDSVTCGKKGKKSLGTKKITGFPHPEYERKKRILKNYKLQLKLKDNELLELLCEVEKYIESIENSRIRSIMRYRYIDDCSWVQVAHRMGGNHTADSCRNAHDRFLGIKK